MATFGDVKIKLEEQPESEGDTEDTEDDDDGMIKGRCYVPPGCPNKEQNNFGDEFESHFVVPCVEINQCVGCISAMTRPCWFRRAMRNRHRHAIEQAARRWRGGRRDDAARTCRKILFSTQRRTWSTQRDVGWSAVLSADASW